MWLVCPLGRARCSKEVFKRPKWADTGEMRPEGAFQRTQERMQDVILDQRLNTFAVCVCLRVLGGRCARVGARCSKEVFKRPKWADTGGMRPEGAFRSAAHPRAHAGGDSWPWPKCICYLHSLASAVWSVCPHGRARHSKEVLKRPKWAETGEMRPEGAFQRTQERMQEVDSWPWSKCICDLHSFD